MNKFKISPRRLGEIARANGLPNKNTYFRWSTQWAEYEAGYGKN